MKPLICNLKMNLDLKEMLEYKKAVEDIASKDLIICPSFCFLPVMYSKKYTLSAQNVSCFEEVNHTGDVSAKQLKSIGVNATLIGHSECHDSFEVKLARLKQALSYNMKVYLILSDTKSDYDYQYTSTKLLGQIRGFLSQVVKSDYQKIVFVYEPSWVVGESTPIDLKDVESIFSFMKKELDREYGFSFSFYYGGGLAVDNIAPYYNSRQIDGLLLGNFSFCYQNMIRFIKSISDSTKVDKTIHN